MSNQVQWVACPECKTRFDPIEYTFGSAKVCKKCEYNIRKDIIAQLQKKGGSDTVHPNKTTHTY